MTATLPRHLLQKEVKRVFVDRRGCSGVMSGSYVPDNLVELRWQLTLATLTGGVDHSPLEWYNAHEVPTDFLKQASQDVYKYFGMDKKNVQIKRKS